MRTYITNLGKYNEGYLIGKWIDLPTSIDEIEDTLKEIGINEFYEEFFITDYEDENGFKIDEYDNIYELNEKMEKLSEYDESVIQAIVESYSSDIDTVIEILEKENYIFYKNMSMEDLAYEIVEEFYDLPDFAKRYFDYEAFARDLSYDGYSETSTGVLLLQ